MSRAESSEQAEPTLIPQPGPHRAPPWWLVVTGLTGLMIPVVLFLAGLPDRSWYAWINVSRYLLLLLIPMVCGLFWPRVSARVHRFSCDEAGVRIDRPFHKSYEPFVGLRSAFTELRGLHPWLLLVRHDGTRVLEVPLITPEQRREAQRLVAAFQSVRARKREHAALVDELSREGFPLSRWAERLDAWDVSTPAYRHAPTDAESLAQLACNAVVNVEARAAAAYLLAKRGDTRLGELLVERAPALVTAMAWVGAPDAVHRDALRACLPYLNESDRLWLEARAAAPRVRVAASSSSDEVVFLQDDGCEADAVGRSISA